VKRLLALAVLLLPLLGSAGLAVEPGEMLSDPVLEARAREISKGLRCLVCQNESIDDSDADLAHEIRLLVRQRLVAGDTDDEVRQFLVDRYGEFVLLRPVIAPHTLVLWFAAPAILILGGTALFLAARRRRNPDFGTLSPEERKALEDLTD